MIWTMKISYQHQTTLKKIKIMTELFESALETRNIKFVKRFENDEKIDYLIQDYSLEGIIVVSKETNGAKLYINIPYTDLCLFSSYFMKFNDNFKNQFDGVLDYFLDQIQKHSNKFNLYLEMQKRSGESTTPKSPAPISPSNSLHSQPISPSTTIESILTEREIEFEKVEGNNITYHIKNNYFKPVIYVFPNGEISFCILSNTGNRISATVWDPKNIHAPSLDRILNHFLGQFESYYNAFSLIKEKLIEIKAICDYNCIRYDSLDMDLKNYTD